MRRLLSKCIFIILLLVGFSTRSMAQLNIPQGINYQGIARNGSGAVLSNQLISVKIGIRGISAGGPLRWEETHQVTTNQLGLFSFIIGKGISTGNGSTGSFDLIPWSATDHFITTAIDPTGGNSFVTLDTTKFWSVPYALYAGSAGKVNQVTRLNDLADVDTTGVVIGYVLKWDGTNWKPARDNNSDTAIYAKNAVHSIHADTASFALNQLSKIDTVKFSNYSDTAVYAFKTNTSIHADLSKYCDTATYALNSGSAGAYWNLNGNTGTTPVSNFIGTIDNKDFVIKTSNKERLRITAGGKIGVGVLTPIASFQVNGDDGFLAAGLYGSGTDVSPGAGSRMHWYPKKAAFRVGAVSGVHWDDAKIGSYSFATGYNSIASGAYSTAIGNACSASGANSFALGFGCNSTRSSAVSIGSACEASGDFAVAIGRAIIAGDSSAIGLGYHSNATGKYSLAFGAYTTASGNYSITMGWYANTNKKKGSFVYADNSSTTATLSTADNQFMVRASGGVNFFSNSDLTAGVSLPPGGGSWASVSDRNKKENFKKVDMEKILKGIEAIEVTSWNYKTQASTVRHIGPMAQDFYKLFNFGESDTTITSIDIDGINLIALKALALKTNELKRSADEVAELKLKLKALEKEKMLLEKRIVAIEEKVVLSQPTVLNR
jgi:hypothetical protein